MNNIKIKIKMGDVYANYGYARDYSGDNEGSSSYEDENGYNTWYHIPVLLLHESVAE